jgi:hypothetical protein
VLAPSGNMALLLTRYQEFSVGPFYNAILLARADDLRDSVEVTPVPFVSLVDGVFHQDIQQVRLLRGDTLAVLADDIVYLTDPRNRAQPRDWIRLPLPGAVAGIQAGGGGSLLYVRLRGDPQIRAYDLRSGGLSVVHDFGVTPFGAVAVNSRYLAAAIPGAVLRIARQGGRTDTIPAPGIAINELAMSPDGSDIVASGLAIGQPGQFSTDLYRVSPR